MIVFLVLPDTPSPLHIQHTHTAFMLTLAETTAAVLGFSIFPKDTSTCGPLEQEERQIF